MFVSTFRGNVDIAYTSPPMTVGEYVWAKGFDGIHLYRMCYAIEDLLFGEVIREAALYKSDQDVTTGSAAGTNLLIDSGAFTDDELLYIGAQGITTKLHADGGGQAFYVTDKIDDNTLKIFCWMSQTSAGVGTLNSDGNWVNALNDTTPSSYDLWKHGRVEDSNAGIPPVGVVQVSGGIDQSVAPYFFAKVSGTAAVLVDDGTSDLLPGQGVYCSANNGHVEGPNAGGAPAIGDLAGTVGVCLHNDIGFTDDQDQLAIVDLRIPLITSSSGQKPRITHPLNAGTI